MSSPEEILEDAFRRVIEIENNGYSVPFIEDAEISQQVELISRNPQNRAAVRLVLACALAKAENSSRDARMPYTEINDKAAFSGRSIDEKYIGPFTYKHQLPVNATTAFLTPALRNHSSVLTRDLNLVGKPRKVYKAALQLLTHLEENSFSAKNLLSEIFRYLIIFRDEKKDRLESLLRNARETRIGAIPLSSEEIINLLQQHLQSPSASRIPVLIVAAAYESAGILIGEKALPLESHNAADKQTGSVGDVEVVLINDISVVSGYEMKDKKITIADIDIAVGKIVSKKEIQNYIFITTEPIGENIREYASSWYEKIGGKEIVVLECISFVRHFLHFFSRHRERFLERYEELLLSEADSSVPQILKETWLTLRQAAEFRPEHRTDA